MRQRRLASVPGDSLRRCLPPTSLNYGHSDNSRRCALSTNCYVVVPGGVTDGAECVVIDPGAEGPRIVGEIRSRGLVPRYVLCTHGHADHTGGVADIVTEFDAQFGIGVGDVDEAVNPPPWLTGVLTDYARPPAPDCELSGGEILEVGARRSRCWPRRGIRPAASVMALGQRSLPATRCLSKASDDMIFRVETVHESWLRYEISCSCWTVRQKYCRGTARRPLLPKSESTTRFFVKRRGA